MATRSVLSAEAVAVAMPLVIKPSATALSDDRPLVQKRDGIWSLRFKSP
jgi:hypothetical protein